jgi:hypothetical protein
VLRGETTNTNFVVFGLTRPGLEPTIYGTQDEHTNHYATEAVRLLKGLKGVINSRKSTDRQENVDSTSISNRKMALDHVHIDI